MARLANERARLSGHATGERRFFSNRLNILIRVALLQNFLGSSRTLAKHSRSKL
jgi:hypothetical protein